MEKRFIGETDLEVSVLCYGPMRLAQTPADLNLHTIPALCTQPSTGVLISFIQAM